MRRIFLKQLTENRKQLFKRDFLLFHLFFGCVIEKDIFERNFRRHIKKIIELIEILVSFESKIKGFAK